jgi:hypothetical protein
MCVHHVQLHPRIQFKAIIAASPRLPVKDVPPVRTDCRQALASNSAYLAWHTLRLFCSVVKGGTQQDLALAVRDTAVADPKPAMPPSGCVLAFDRVRVAREFAAQAVDACLDGSAPLGASVERALVLQTWLERMPARHHWAGDAAAGDSRMDVDSHCEDGAASPSEVASDGGAGAWDGLFGEALRGVAIVQPQSNGKKLKVVCHQQLSLDIKTRFFELFDIKPQWTAEDMMPYLQRVYEAGCKNAGELLLRYTRAVRDQPDMPTMHYAR